MTYFQVNENCNGCLACVQNCPAGALDARESEGVQTLLHNWRICPQQAVEFQYMLQNRWDEVVAHVLVRCEVCGEVVHAERLKESLEPKIRELAEPLCPRHKMERQAEMLARRRRPVREAAR
jgi:ferredoxin hydrogenase large subunit